MKAADTPHTPSRIEQGKDDRSNKASLSKIAHLEEMPNYGLWKIKVFERVANNSFVGLLLYFLLD